MSVLDDLAWPAVRYALGRRTYVTGMVSDALIASRERLSPETRRIIVADIDEATAKGGLGDACDAEAWQRLRAVLVDVS